MYYKDCINNDPGLNLTHFMASKLTIIIIILFIYYFFFLGGGGQLQP